MVRTFGGVSMCRGSAGIRQGEGLPMAAKSIFTVGRAGLIGAIALMSSGCAAPIVGALGVSELFTVASLGGTVAFNKGASDLALDIVTGQNCRIVEGIVRKDREICEPDSSKAADNDFKGVVGFVAENQDDLELVTEQELDRQTGEKVEVATWRLRARGDGQIEGHDATAVIDTSGSN